MAKMHPNYGDAEIAKMEERNDPPGIRGEMQLYRELRKLPDNWDVLYNNNLWAGGQNVQIDFLVFCPGKGVVNVDAKGDGYRFEDNQWYLGDNRNDIFGKAQRAIHTFDKYVNLFGSPWGAYGSLVAFLKEPDIRSRGGIPGNMPHILPQDIKDGKLKDFIERQLDEHKDHHRYFTPQIKSYILDHFNQKFGFKPFSFEFSNYDEQLKPFLTLKQLEIMEVIKNNAFIHVTGGAGTGKTVLAMACAQKFAGQGKKVLYVCYNRILADYLSQSCKNGNILITHYDGIPEKLFGQHVPTDDNGGHDDWKKIHEKIADMITAQGKRWSDRDKFDLILIDEAQDMDTNMLYYIQALAKEFAPVAFFSDSAQSIFQNGWKFPGEYFPNLKTCDLMVNLRNTDRIHDRIVKYSGEKTRPLGEIPGKKPEDFDCSVVELIRRLKDEGRQSGDIAVLGYKKDHLDQIENSSQNDIFFTDILSNWHDRGKILKTTVQSFKGLEANVIIVADADDVPMLDEKEQNRLRYVCESRAKYLLYLHRTKK